MTDSTRKYRIIGIPNTNIVEHAERLEAAMNELEQDGWSFQLVDKSNGTMIIAFRQAEEEEPAQDFFQALRERIEHARASASAPLGDKARIIVDRVSRLNPLPGLDFAELVKRHSSELLRGLNAEDLSVAAKDLDEAATAHTRGHRDGDTCPVTVMLRSLANAARATAQSRLQ